MLIPGKGLILATKHTIELGSRKKERKKQIYKDFATQLHNIGMDCKLSLFDTIF